MLVRLHLQSWAPGPTIASPGALTAREEHKAGVARCERTKVGKRLGESIVGVLVGSLRLDSSVRWRPPGPSLPRAANCITKLAVNPGVSLVSCPTRGLLGDRNVPAAWETRRVGLLWDQHREKCARPFLGVPWMQRCKGSISIRARRQTRLGRGNAVNVLTPSQVCLMLDAFTLKAAQHSRGKTFARHRAACVKGHHLSYAGCMR